MIAVSQVAGTLTIPRRRLAGPTDFRAGAGLRRGDLLRLLRAPHRVLEDGPDRRLVPARLAPGDRGRDAVPGAARALSEPSIMGLAVGLAQQFKYNGWLTRRDRDRLGGLGNPGPTGGAEGRADPQDIRLGWPRRRWSPGWSSGPGIGSWRATAVTPPCSATSKVTWAGSRHWWPNFLIQATRPSRSRAGDRLILPGLVLVDPDALDRPATSMARPRRPDLPGRDRRDHRRGVSGSPRGSWSSPHTGSA